jgi:pyruvate/2-oxoglutarate dehydrogenase complex dihydrolipoamide dehydrogenase (E3) component
VSEPEKFDALVIGSGQGGTPLARALAATGRKTALIERTHVGGTCVNEGCTPTKTMAASARMAYLARRAGDYGIETGPVAVDMSSIRARKRRIVEDWRNGGERRLRETENLELVTGSARFVDVRMLEVTFGEGAGPRAVAAPLVVIDTGTRPSVPPLPGLHHVPFLDSTTVMELGEVPSHLLVLGGGYVAVEFAQMFRRFGSEVTVIQRDRRLLSREDPDIAELLAGILRDDGVEIVLEAKASSVTGPQPIEMTVSTSGGERVVRGSHLLIATGRVPNTEHLRLEATGVALDERGFIPVNERLETNVAGIYAIGDVKGGPAFTHISYDDYRILAANLLYGGSRSTAGRLVPYTIFTDPQLGRVGMTETEARDEGLAIRVVTLPVSSVARAIETGETRGVLKAVIDAKTDQILGCAALSTDGGELMAMIEVAMLGHLPARVLADAVFAHPTLGEALNNLFAAR